MPLGLWEALLQNCGALKDAETAKTAADQMVAAGRAPSEACVDGVCEAIVLGGRDVEEGVEWVTGWLESAGMDADRQQAVREAMYSHAQELATQAGADAEADTAGVETGDDAELKRKTVRRITPHLAALL